MIEAQVGIACVLRENCLSTNDETLTAHNDVIFAYKL